MPLGEDGRALYASITDKYELNVDELELVTMASESADDLGRLEKALHGAPVMVAGSMGQEKVNPLFAEVRATRALIGQLLTRLKLPDAAVDSAKSEFNAARARKAAGSRWGH